MSDTRNFLSSPFALSGFRRKLYRRVTLFVLLFLTFPLQAVVIGSNTTVSTQAHVSFPANDSDNEIRGFSAMESGFTLENSSTTCLFNSYFPITGDISLNAGVFNLGRPLIIQEEVRLTNVGTVDGNFYSLTCTTTQGFTLPSGIAVGVDQPGVLTLIDEENTRADVYSVDWSYDNNYIASGSYKSDGNELQIFSFDGSALSISSSLNLGDSGLSVAWSPVNYFLAVGRDRAGGNELFIYEFNPGAGTITQKAGLNTLKHGKAVAWHNSGNYLIALLDRENDTKTTDVVLYAISSSGALSQLDIVSFSDKNNEFSRNALSWKSSYDFFSIGLEKIGTTDELQVYSFNGSNTIALSASSNIGETVKAVAWHPVGNYIAVGLGGGSERLRMYEHTGGALVEKTSARVGESVSVLSLDWSLDGSQLVVGVGVGSGTEFRVYNFDSSAVSLTLSSELSSPTDVNTVKWSPDGLYIARGDDNNMVGIYNLPGVAGDPFFGTSFKFNNLSTHFNSDIVLKKNILFQGACVLDGNGHMIDLQQGAQLVLDNGASLLLKNVVVKNVSANRIKCLDATGVISLCGVEWLFNGNFTFTQGSIDILGDARMTGEYIFVYQSAQVSTIKSDATWYFDTGMTLKYDTSSSNLLTMEDSSSKLHLYEATLYSTVPGLSLTRGTLIVEGTCPVLSDAGTQADGITFGDGIFAANNLIIKTLDESGLNLQSGFLVNKNV